MFSGWPCNIFHGLSSHAWQAVHWNKLSSVHLGLHGRGTQLNCFETGDKSMVAFNSDNQFFKFDVMQADLIVSQLGDELR